MASRMRNLIRNNAQRFPESLVMKLQANTRFSLEATMRRFFGIGLCVLSLGVVARADVQLITNGGFESGSLAPWVATSSVGSGGAFFENSGTFSPLNGFPTVGASSGTFYGVSDSFGPGTNALSQSFTVPVGATTEILSYDLFVDDWGGAGSGGTEKVWLLAGGSSPLTGPVLASFAIVGPTVVTGGLPNPYHSYIFDITADVVPGLTYQIDFLESDSSAPINMGVDNVGILARTSTPPVPEPSSLALLLGVVALLGVSLKYRRAQGRVL